MGKLTTHVLDTMHGTPAKGVTIALYADRDGARTLIKEIETNDDGRCSEPLLQADTMAVGVYELIFDVGAYFAKKGVVVPEPKFLDRVVIRFGIANPAENYHVPLVATPWTYFTYRGS